MNESAYIGEVFGDGGYLAKANPGYEPRPQQVRLAQEVERAFSDARHLLAEGPCGVGKSFAYLVPAVHHATQRRKKVVIATANIALQEQLVAKDLPFLQRILPWKFTFALMKGIGNYLCLEKLSDVEVKRAGMFGGEPDLDRLWDWSQETLTGDMSELKFQPAPQAWSQVSTTSDECLGKDCPFREDCHAYAARDAAAEADIVVTNYHMLFAHLQIRRETGMDALLPPFDFLICDEAHKAPDIARDFFGFKVSRSQLRRLSSTLEKLGWEKLAKGVREAADSYFDQVSDFFHGGQYKTRLKAPLPFRFTPLQVPLGEALRDLRREEEQLEEDAPVDGTKAMEGAQRRLGMVRRARKATENALTRLKEVDTLANAESVYFIETGQGENISLCAKPISAAPALKSELFDLTESVVVVSATLSTGGSFDYIRKELGVDNALELEVGSPFNFQEQALLIVPHGLPAPNDEGFIDKVGDAFDAIIHGIGGRTLGLFTSYKNLNAVHERIGGNGFTVLKQGDAPRGMLIDRFKREPATVLLGTESFWAGVDVPGESLSCVIIDKIPFPTPDDPVLDAITARNKNWFADYSIPRAIIQLKQGFGRLIRCRTDRGAVVICDPRLVEKGYGRKFIAALPPTLKSRDIAHVADFLGGQS